MTARQSVLAKLDDLRDTLVQAAGDVPEEYYQHLVAVLDNELAQVHETVASNGEQAAALTHRALQISDEYDFLLGYD